MEKRKQGNLFSPNRITKMCCLVEVELEEADQVFTDKRVINDAAIERLKVVDHNKRGGNIVFAINEVTTN